MRNDCQIGASESFLVLKSFDSLYNTLVHNTEVNKRFNL
jgi:hypothetical protein